MRLDTILSTWAPGALAAILILIASPANAETSTPGMSQNLTSSPDGHFEFQISPWISLHHFAWHLARENERELRLRGRVPVRGIDRQMMSSEFKAQLPLIYRAYTEYLDGDLLFSDRLRQMSRALSLHGPDAIKDDAIRSALKAVMPVYLETYWSAHQARSQAMLLELLPLLVRHERQMVTRLSRELESEWANNPIRVDLTVYANRQGAYTENAPNRITISTTDDTITSEHIFEILFHESVHTTPLGQGLRGTINNALEKAQVSNERIWHDVLFYITGKAANDVLGAENHHPYVKRAGIYQRKKADYQLIEQAWDKESSFSARATELARLLSTSGSSH